MTHIPDDPSASLHDEPYRPQFHYSAPYGWLNDPNGLVYYDGEYHLFFQYHPHSTVWGPMHWGHAVSTDLIQWETLPIALYPDHLGTIFSGTVVVDPANSSGLVPGGGLVALYTYSTQTQGVAYSTDRGRTWTKYTDNPIIPALRPDFRDPKVFWHDRRWVMVLSAGQSIMFLTSPDLLQWEVVSEFGSGYEGGVWEVPDLFPMTVDGITKWLLVFSVNPTAPAGGGGTRYAVGNFDGRTFVEDTPGKILWLDWGPDNYAGTTYNNIAEGRRLFVAWMSNWAYANKVPTSVWRGAMTIPRALSLAKTSAGYRLAQRPVDALHNLRMPLGTWENITVDGPLALDAICGQTLDIELDVALADATAFGMSLSTGAEDAVRISYDVPRREMIIHRSDAGIPYFNPSFVAPLEPDDGQIRLRILVDSSSIEVFANDGLLSLTSQVFPGGDILHARVFAEHGMACVRSLRAYHLRSIWSERT